MKTRKLIILISAMFIFIFAAAAYLVALGDEVATVPSNTPASAVVKLPGCTGVLVAPSWVLTIAHCVDHWSDRTSPEDRDVYITDGTVITFTDPVHSESIPVDRVVRIDGAETGDNSLSFLHLSRPAPPWVEWVPLYEGPFPDPDERMEIWGYGGHSVRTVGGVNIVNKWWRSIDEFWALCLQANPSHIVPGDSGGPVITNTNGKKEVIGINWNSGVCGGASPCGGMAAATFNISDDGNTNNVNTLAQRIMHASLGNGAKSLDIENDGTNEIVFYDAKSGELRLLGIGDYTRFEVRLIEKLPTDYHFLEVGDFNGDGLSREIVLIKGDTGELRGYSFQNPSSGNYFLVPWRRYTTFYKKLLPGIEPFIISGATSGDYNGDGKTELILVDRENSRIHMVNVETGQYLGATTHAFFGDALIFSSGRFRTSSTRDRLVICTVTSALSAINFYTPVVSSEGTVSFSLNSSRIIPIDGKVSQMVTGKYDADSNDDLFLYRSRYSSGMEWLLTIITDVNSTDSTVLMDQTLSSEFNFIIPGNFHSDNNDEIALWKRAYDDDRQAMYVYSISDSGTMINCSARVWNWTNRSWTHMQ